MQLSTLLFIQVTWCILRGVGFILAPAKLWKTFNINLDKHTALPVQLLGAAYVAAALMNWTSLRFVTAPSLQSVIVFNFTMELLGMIITAYGVISKSVSKVGWIPFMVHSFITLAFGYFLFYS